MIKQFFWIIGCILLLCPGYSAQAQSSSVLFIPNEGQWSQDFLYKGISPNVDIYLEHGGITYLTGAPENNALIEQYKDGNIDAPTLKFHAYKMKWLNGNQQAAVVPQSKQTAYHNYYLGSDPQRWKSNVSLFGNVTFKEIYQGIDFYFYSENSYLKYDLVVQPNADINKIKLQYEGTNGLSLEKGNLQIQTSVGKIIEQKPYAFQYVDGVRREVKCEYVLNGDVLSFKFPKGYDKSQVLTIDPQMVFATLTGSIADNWGFTATYDAAGNLYAGGIARGAGYPVGTGAFQTTYGGGSGSASLGIDCDISISKFNATGTSLVYSTYIGGSSNEMPHSLIVDQNNNLVISGKSASTNYPTTTGAFRTTNAGDFDIIVTKLNAGGTALVGSTYIGGTAADGVNISANYNTFSTLKHNYGDDSRSEVIVDNTGNIYLSSNTQSANFPVSANALKSSLGGTQDGVFLKFNPTLTTLTYGTYLGGTSVDGAYSIALDKTQAMVYVSGGTQSTDFHSSSTAGAWQASNAGGIDGYIMRFQNSGTYPLIRTTYVGTTAYDQNYGIQVDKENNVYVMGQTQGSFPVSPGVYNNPGSRQFLLKLDSTLATRIYSTVYGSGSNVSNANISPVAFLVDTCENVYISGWGGLTSAAPATSVLGMPITSNAIQPTTDGADFYFIVLSSGAQSLLYGTYFGAPSKEEHVDGGTSRFDPKGVVYQAICASCGAGSAFPSTPGAYATTKGSSNCNLGAVKIAFNLGSVSVNAAASPSTSGCVPFTVQFQDNSSNATSWSWAFGDGGFSTAQTPTHTYTTPGTYNVRLIGSNPEGCITEDTSYVTITVRADTVNADFTYTILDSCFSPKVQFNNTSVGINGGPTTGATFVWDFGDGNSFTGANPPVHSYAGTGPYNIKLKMTMPGACNNPDSVIKTINFSNLFVNANPIPDISACVHAAVDFPDSSSNAISYQWDFGDGTQATTSPTSHVYTQSGTYTARLIVGNPNTCNKFDTIYVTVTVHSTPTALFTFSPTVGEPNEPFTFTNMSRGATSYLWNFGDGRSSTETNPVFEYRRSGTYEVCLTATNEFNCSDKICKELTASIYPIVDLPTAFSPNGDGNNDILRIRGYGIEKVNLQIFNRWGEKVFETSELDKGWDGKYKGVLQEMDTYGYLLTADFFDGSTTKKQGNVTLMR
ncbi:gliding motility-associated C-terminal domain-containing protein [Edaphocola aurantiacus]|uniref:gliding motility-associated C-terminal domain-containing protein n=1 Tax=Edaphocola aurantiacus TaxID=2601682 RepID=UPI001C9514B6|nr:PKD domain-containing protein [Edaphocola aurantiacus]